MIDGFLCDKCQMIVEFENTGVIASVLSDNVECFTKISLCKDCLNKRLIELTSQMNVPLNRRSDPLWLNRNIGIHNPDNLKLREVQVICKALIKKI